VHPKNIEGGVAKLTLKIRGFSGGGEPVLDTVYINGNRLPQLLTRPPGSWTTLTVDVPVDLLKFPDQQSAGGGPVPAENSIELRSSQAAPPGPQHRDLEVDWGRFVVKGIRPWVLVHGFGSGGGVWRWEQDLAPAEGIPTHSFSFANNNDSWQSHAQEVEDAVQAAKRRFGVQKVNVVAHSKGGIDTRAYLSGGAQDVENFVMIATPNSGSPLADLGEAGKLFGFAVSRSEALLLWKEPALSQLTVTYMAFIFNRIIDGNPSTRYASIPAIIRREACVPARAICQAATITSYKYRASTSCRMTPT